MNTRGEGTRVGGVIVEVDVGGEGGVVEIDGKSSYIEGPPTT